MDQKSAQVDTAITISMNGHPVTGTTPTDDLQATLDTDDVLKPDAVEDVTALDRILKCKVYRGTGGFGGPCGGGPFTMWICDEMPGGIVKYAGDGPGGNPMTLTVTSFKTGGDVLAR